MLADTKRANVEIQHPQVYDGGQSGTSSASGLAQPGPDVTRFATLGIFVP
jgi:hypothetical protein